MTDSEEALATGATLKDKYRIEERLGAGGMALVYRARNIAVDRTVAIKVLNPRLTKHKEAVERFKREAKAANLARHPNIVDVLDVDQDGGVLFIVQEYLRGEDLTTRLRRDKQLIVDDVLAIMGPVVDAVAAAHAKGLVHRDLKPDNVYLAQVDGEMVPKVLDFGISKMPLADLRIAAGGAAPVSIRDGRITMAGVAMGTPYYMSPEQIRDPGSVDARTDVWSLGVMLYEALSGSLPFDAKDMSQLFAQIHTHEPRPLERVAPHVPAGLARAVQKCLRVARDERYPDAGALARALGRARSPIADEPSRDEPSRPSPEKKAPAIAFDATEIGTRPSNRPAASVKPATKPAPNMSLELELPVSTSRAPVSSSRAQASDAPQHSKPPVDRSPPPHAIGHEEDGADLSWLDNDDDDGDPFQLAVDVPTSSKRAATSAPRPIVAATADRDRPQPDSQRRIHLRQHTVNRPLSAAYIRFLLAGVVVLGIAGGAAFLAPSGMQAAHDVLGPRAPWPFAGATLVLLVALIWTATYGLRLVSFSLFLASAGLAVSGTAAAFATLSMAAPGLVPRDVTTVGLVAGPWAALAVIAGFVLFALAHGRELRKSDDDERLLGNLLIVAALIGIGAGVWAVRQPHTSLDDVKNMRPAVAGPTRDQFRRVAIDAYGARPRSSATAALPLRTPSRGAAAVKAIPKKAPAPKP